MVSVTLMTLSARPGEAVMETPELGFACRVPPGAGAWGEPVVAVENLHGFPLSFFRGLQPERASLRASFRRQPVAIVSPQARARRHFDGSPVLRVDRPAAPAVFDEESRRRIRVERRHEVVRVPSKSRRDAALFSLREIVRLPDIVEHVELHHQVVNRVLAGLHHREAVMARIQVKEVRLERTHREVAELKSKRVSIERQDIVDALDVEHDVAHAERTGAKTRNRAARPEWIARGFLTVERLEP